jgi:hypothetical protein
MSERSAPLRFSISARRMPLSSVKVLAFSDSVTGGAAAETLWINSQKIAASATAGTGFLITIKMAANRWVEPTDGTPRR